VLYEAAVEAVQDRSSQAKAKMERRPQPKGRSRVRLVLLLVLGAVGGTLLAIRPSWLVGPETLPQESPAIAAASLRVALVRERDMVIRYQQRTGNLPGSLSDAGVLTPDLDYRQEGGSFSLSGQAGDSLITISSADSVTVFLGDSFARLRRRNTP